MLAIIPASRWLPTGTHIPGAKNKLERLPSSQRPTLGTQAPFLQPAAHPNPWKPLTTAKLPQPHLPPHTGIQLDSALLRRSFPAHLTPDPCPCIPGDAGMLGPQGRRGRVRPTPFLLPSSPHPWLFFSSSLASWVEGGEWQSRDTVRLVSRAWRQEHLAGCTLPWNCKTVSSLSIRPGGPVGFGKSRTAILPGWAAAPHWG